MSRQTTFRATAVGGATASKTSKTSSIKVTKMIKAPTGRAKYTPSSYLFERKRTTDEKLASTQEMYPPRIIELLDIGTSSHQKDVSLDVDQALFQPFPSEVVFQQFEAHKTYVFPLQLRNLDKVARHIKESHDESPYFSVSCQKLAGSKVAPGMEITYQITFTPDENKDYKQELVFVTEREKFVVPVRAIGARALLDFPDDVTFSSAPVKYESMKTVLVRNVGNREAKFTLKTEQPFSVSPHTATLAVNACMQVSVGFTPKKLGDHNQELMIQYDTGEEVYTQLYGTAINVNVTLDRSSLVLDDTYLSLSSQRSVIIHNRSDVVVHYQWKAFASELEEDFRRQTKAQQLAEEENLSKETFYDRCMLDPSIRDRLPILTRSLDLNRKKYLDEERFLFSDEAVTLDPIEGEIWPNSQAEVSVIFQPNGARAYSSDIYCDVTGRESRLLLKVRGEGLGPQCVFSFDALDIQNVFVSSEHSYEVVMENKGDIEAEYSLVKPDSLFGPKFSFDPSKGVLYPGQLQVIQILFRSSELGSFNEEFLWPIQGSPEPLHLRVQGEVIGPTFQFNTQQLKFGNVPYGFKSTIETVLTNTSDIPMTFALRVPGSDSSESSGSKEFEIEPQFDTLSPNCKQSIKLHFTPLSVKSYSTMLIVDIEEAGENVASLPVTARSLVPTIQLLTPLLDYGRCFLKHCYSRTVELLNDSDFPVKYILPPQVDKSALVYSSPQSKGIIMPHTSLSIQLHIETQTQGEIMTSALIDIFGSTEPQLEVGICCIGEGPVINVSPESLHWGVCPVLTPIVKTVLLSNESLIPAEFECTMARDKTIFTVDPISAVIPPNKSLQLSVTALVDDSLKFSDKLTIVVSEGVSFTVSMSAEGRGTTIMSHPRLQPSVDLGHYFSTGACERQFTLTNRGRRVQALSWTTEGFSAAKLKKAEIEKKARDKKDVALKRLSSKILEVKKPLFEMSPNKCILEPYQSIVVTLRGYSDVPQAVNERLICYAIIGKNPLKERIMTVDVKATFVAPLLEFSSQELSFKLLQPPGSKLVHHSQELGVRNVSPLPVTSLLYCDYPFSLVRNGVPLAQMELVLGPSQNSSITVLYDSTYCADKHSRQEDTFLAVAYKEHPQKDRISLKSEVHFPNLHFEAMELDFGCILNDTENIQYLTMTNNSPLEVNYSWYFLKRPPVQRVDPSQLDEGVDMQSECETDSLDEQSDSDEEAPGNDTSERETGDIGLEPENLSENDSNSKPPLKLDDIEHHSACSRAESHSASIPQSEKLHNSSLGFTGDEDELQDKHTSQDHSKESLPHLEVTRASEDNLEESIKSGQSSRQDGSVAVPAVKQKQPWELLADPFTPIRIEQIFDILPLHGVLQPGQSQQVQFSFYGHSGVATEVTAACKVEGGPTYQLRLSGEASEVQYRFSQKTIDVGKMMYDQALTSQVILYNRGKVGFDYCALGIDASNLQDTTPGSLSIHPLTGHLPALEEQVITITYLPSFPAVFQKRLQIQVAHFEPDVITLTGEAVFPRISFDCPQDLSQVPESIFEQAKCNLSLSTESERSDRHDQILEAELERLLVGHSREIPTLSTLPRSPKLPDFHLNFGYVVYGTVRTHLLHLTNVGHIPVSFTTPHKLLQGTGFRMELGDRVKSLPPSESLEFLVSFDPCAIKCPEGERKVKVPFNLVGGPSYSLVLSAHVTRPSMQFSEEHIDFGPVVCGQSRVVTISLSNPFSVSCEWTAITERPPKKIPRHIPLHVRKKMKEKLPPKFFEVIPSSGVLQPGDSSNIMVTFMPSEEIHYSMRIPFSIRQNADSNLCLYVEGGGSEPQLIFTPSLVEFEPVLPFSQGSEAEVTVTNPMPYPVEFYSLEFDKQYLEEEEVLRWVKGYDNKRRLYLPPPVPGESLPREILTAFEKQKALDSTLPQKTDTEIDIPSQAQFGSVISVQVPSQIDVHPSDNAVDFSTQQPSTYELGSTIDLPVIESLPEIINSTEESLSKQPKAFSSVKRAIRHYLGIDTSSELKGVAIIVHGPPSSGRSSQAKLLAEEYDAALLVLDEVIIDAISSPTTESGVKARKACMKMLTPNEEVNEAPSNLFTASKKQLNTKEKDKDGKEQIPELPPLPEAPSMISVNVLEGSDYPVPSGQLMPTELDENVVKTILADRLKCEDCFKGVIIDGIDSQFTSGAIMSTSVLLYAIGTRSHIYFVNLEMSLKDIQKRLENIENAKKLEEEKAQEELVKKELEEKERIEHLLTLDEDEYEAMSSEEQREIDMIRLSVKKEQREKRRQEKEEQEQRERELLEEEMRRLEEEKGKKKGRKDPSKQQRPSNAVKPPAITNLLQQATVNGQSPRPGSSTAVATQQSLGGMAVTASGASMTGLESPGGTPKKKMGKKGSARASAILEGEDGEGSSPLHKKHNYYSTMIDAIKQNLEDWDRQKLKVRPKKPPAVEEQTSKSTPSRRVKGGKQKEEQVELLPESPIAEECREGLGIPLVSVKAEQTINKVTTQLFSLGLPSQESILEALGLGDQSPPLPGPMDFQVYPFPTKRRNIDHVPQERFCFIAAFPDDPNAPKEEVPKPVSESVQEEPPREQSPSRMSKRTGSVRSMEGSDSSSHRKSPQKNSRKKSTNLKTSSPSPSQLATTHEDTPPPTKPEPKPTGPPKLIKFRWVVPPGGETKMKLLFQSQDFGQFDQTLNFEICGTRRRTQLFCRGYCVVPSICQEPRIVFPSRKKTKRKDEIVHKRFILTENTYYFGPLHCGKTRERYKEGRYPENMEKILIKNASLGTTEVNFYFQHDYNAATFLLDPPNMTLEQGEEKILTIWAYPKSSIEFKDALVCCIKHNPNPIVFKIVCDGVEPELKVDHKLLEFKKVLLHRKQTNILYLHNHTMLPVAWKLSGLETLGEEFSFSQEQGVVQPLSDFPLSVNFRASKQVNHAKKAFKIEISDVEQIMGLMHVETVQVVAEAYDVALDISFPKGTDGGLDFQCIRACDDHKLTVHLKNKGKYDIAYNFLFDLTNDGVDYTKMFHVTPTHNTLYPSEKAQPVNIVFRSDKEVTITNLPILKCQVIDAHVGEGEVIANIPIRVSAKAVFAHCVISPVNDINFGPMTVNTRRSASFTLENKGDFEFKYAITKRLSAEQQKIRTISMAAVAAKNRTKSREGGRESSARLSLNKPYNATTGGKHKSEGPLRTEVIGGSQRLVLGMFTINTAMGSISAGQSQIITVDCIADDKPGTREEVLSIEVSDRQKDSPPLEYKISGEVLQPEINTTDVASIFEEHRVCRRLGVLGQHQFHGDGCVGVYGEEERRFMFKSVIVGQSSKARFKISNQNKIPCDVLISVKSATVKQKSSNEAFEVQPSSRIAIPSHSHIYASVTFKPMAMQNYNATFEVAPEGTRSKGLTFDLQGEGNLPQVTITQPTLHNARGDPLLLFSKLLLSQSQVLPIMLRNTGTISAKVVLENPGSKAFSIVDTENLGLDSDNDTSCDSPQDMVRKSASPCLVDLDVNEGKECMVVFKPHSVKKYRSEMRVRVLDNQFEKMLVQLVGEGYEDEVYLENVRGEVLDSWAQELEEVSDDIEATTQSHLRFGSIAVAESRQIMFTLTNRSQSNSVKFQWPTSLPCLSFMPAVGHIKPGASKDIAVVFSALTKPESLHAQRISGKICKISFSQPLSKVPDWDDRMKSVRWVNIRPPQTPSLESSTNGSVSKHNTVPVPTPAKKKVIETDPEPAHSVVDESHRDMEILISGIADFVKFDCAVKDIRFKDTLMYQSKAHSFSVSNTGLIPLTYQWIVVDENASSSQSELKQEMSMPFSIEPCQGVIQPNSESTFIVKFAPLDVVNAQCTLRCNIPNLDSSMGPLSLLVYGHSLMPYCHFEVEHSSDYFSRRSGESRRSFGSSGTIDPVNTRVIEFTSCGVGVKYTKSFEVINPTSSGYEFRWTTDTSLQHNNAFKCLTPRGYVEGGKKYEIVFEYSPSSLETVESLWTFSIPSICLSHPFLLVGNTGEPSVNLDRAYITFKAMLIGTRMKETVYMVNNEPTAYKFFFDKKSCHCDGHSGQLVVEPMTGTIQPNTKLPITVSFTARHEQDYNFNLKCNIKHKPDPLILNVKATGYAINTALSYTSPNGTEVSLPVAKPESRIINFGSVPVNERALGQISIFNHGQYNMEYKWVLSSKCKLKTKGEVKDLVFVSPLEGTVVPQDRVRCEVTFSPPTKMVLKGCELQLQIVNGPTLPITIRGMGVEPQMEFSFEEHDFGPCFLHRSDMPASRKSLTVINNDKKDVSVHCLFKDKPYLSVRFNSCILAPKEEAQAVLEFKPQDTVPYSESVVFEINGLSRKAVSVKGNGAQMKIELANSAQKKLNFGALRIGEKVKKDLDLVNHSPIPLSFRLSLLPRSNTPALHEEGVLCVSPTEEVTFEGNGGLSTVSITFSPKTRVPQFSDEEVTLECLGTSQTLCTVSGSCIGLEISLDAEYVPFGPVVQDSQSSRRILMINSGDIGARFSWEDKFGPDFTLTPLDGYISPGMQITFDLTFHPTKLSQDIRYEKIPCHIEGKDKPLYLTLTGVCIEKVPVKEVLPFTTNVRSKETRHLTIPNKTNSNWVLRPLIEGEQWSGPETLSIGPNQSRHYELTYHPLTMTTDMQKHYGSIFFPQPDGTGILYNLQGTAEPPKHAGAITQEIPCKTFHTELLPVENWLRRPQRFRVDVHMVRPEKLDRSVSLYGLDYIDLPALGKRDYKLHFHSYKECSILAKVTFRNELSGEYLYYHVSFKSTPPGIIGTIEVTTPVRKSNSKQIKVTNPLPTPVTISTNCDLRDITLPSTFLVGAQSEGNCTFEYLPLKAGETTGKLTLSNSDLGVYQYELHLTATTPPPERHVNFTTSLGTSQQQPVKFMSYARGRTEYTCKVDNNDFHVERNITVASAGTSGTEASVEVNFEPSHLGDTHATLTISSHSCGDYSFPLHGHCLAPKPQGPFNIKPGSSISIPFKNVFTQSTQFTFSVDNPAFIVKSGDTLKARKTYNILLSYDAKQADSNVAKTGKLTVTSQQSAKPGGRGKSSVISWVYYLKGLPPA